MDICLYFSTVEMDPISTIIRNHLKCDWSHVGFMDTATRRTFSAKADGRGVDWREPNLREKILLVDHPRAAAMLEKAETHKGFGYDFLNILGIMTGLNLISERHDICDKLVLWSAIEIGAPLLNPRYIPIEHMTPRDVLLAPSLIFREHV